MTVLEDTLIKLTRVLERNAVPYMIIGGLANAIWGEPRATVDIDATVWVAEDRFDAIVSILQKKFRSRVPDPVSFLRETHVFPLESEGGVLIDLIFGFLPFEKEAIDRAVGIQVCGISVRFCTPEDLILHKIISERKRDLDDASGVIIRQLKRLDFSYLEPRIRELAEALERPEILDLWKRWKQEAEERVS
jgi:hypothetical protein